MKGTQEHVQVHQEQAIGRDRTPVSFGAFNFRTYRRYPWDELAPGDYFLFPHGTLLCRAEQAVYARRRAYGAEQFELTDVRSRGSPHFGRIRCLRVT